MFALSQMETFEGTVVEISILILSNGKCLWENDGMLDDERDTP